MDELTRVKAMCFDLSEGLTKVHVNVKKFLTELGEALNVDLTAVKTLDEAISKIKENLITKE